MSSSRQPIFSIAITIIGVLLFLAAITVFFANNRSPRQSTDNGKMSVTASFYPLAEFARNVGLNLVVVRDLTPSGTEPHDYEPTAADRITIQRSKVFIYNGVGLENWVQRILPDLQDTQIINATDGLSLLKAADEEDPTKLVTDPHVWLSPVLAQQIVNHIRDGFIAADPAHELEYMANASAYTQQLAALDSQYSKGLKQCQRREIVTSHTAFGYLASQYRLQQEPIAGLAEEEPSPAKLAEVAKFVRDHGVTKIFFESLVSPRLSQTIASETGAKTAVLNPIEGLTADQSAAGASYSSLMQENLTNLRDALGCE